MEHLVHKVNITEEAEFDIECISASSNFNKQETKNELEFYIKHQKKVQNKHYYRLVDYLGDIQIIYFIKKGIRMGIMQMWNVVGVCEAQYWDEEMEDLGIIRGWYETKLNPDKDEPDWVEQLRERQILEERERKLDEEQQRRYERLFGY